MKAAMLVEGSAVLQHPTVASMARAFDVSPRRVAKALRRLGVKPKARRRPPFALPAPPAAPAFMLASG
jgi:hypothetical protein